MLCMIASRLHGVNGRTGEWPQQVAEKGPSAGDPERLGARCVIRRAHHEREESYAWTHLRRVPRPGYPSGRMGDSAWHLDLFEHPGQNRVFQHSARGAEARRCWGGGSDGM
jgi:hypothetical protein